MAGIQVSIMDNGPYIVKGEIEITDADGNVIKQKGKQAALCRCGASTTKPFCDGQHSKIGFQAAERATGQHD